MRILRVTNAAGAVERGAIDEAARVLAAGGIVAFPTETVYGLGARALDERAVLRVFAAKGRPAGHPLIAHVDGEEMARALSASWSARGSRLARAFWPGPLTLVVPRGARVPRVVTGGGDTLAVRAPAHPVARALIAAVGEPLAAPSANPYQTLSATTAEHVVKGLGDKVDLVLDGGPCDAGIESTVLDVCAEPPRVLRPGALDVVRLRDVLPEVVAEVEVAPGDATRASPGMDPRHYAPSRARLIVAAGAQACADAISDAWDAGAARVGLITRTVRATPAPRLEIRGLPNDPVQYARDLFAILHALEDADCEVIVVEAPPDDERWWAIADRLRRASTG